MEAKRTKKYFTTIPLQTKPEDLQKVPYEPIDNLGFKCITTRFPIISVIVNTAMPEDEINVGLILTCENGSPIKPLLRNYELFKQELDEIKNDGLIKDYHIDEIKTEDNEKIETQIKLLIDMMSYISDNEYLYACATYGTKPTSIVMMLGLNFGYKIKNNTTVENVVYGQIKRGDNAIIVGSYLYDITKLFYADSFINRFAGSNEIENFVEIFSKFFLA